MDLEMIAGAVKKLTGFGKSVVAEVDGSGSASRVIGLIVALVTMGVLVAHVCIHHSLPLPAQLYGLSALVGAGSSAYAANKFNGPAPPAPPVTPSTPSTAAAPAQPAIVDAPEGGH